MLPDRARVARVRAGNNPPMRSAGWHPPPGGGPFDPGPSPLCPAADFVVSGLLARSRPGTVTARRIATRPRGACGRRLHPAFRTHAMTHRIRTTRTASGGAPQPRRLRRPELDDVVEFDDEGVAHVSDSDAQYLTSTYDYMELADTDDASADSDDGDDCTCTVETTSGDVCGRDRPCQYHD